MADSMAFPRISSQLSGSVGSKALMVRRDWRMESKSLGGGVEAPLDVRAFMREGKKENGRP